MGYTVMWGKDSGQHMFWQFFVLTALCWHVPDWLTGSLLPISHDVTLPAKFKFWINSWKKSFQNASYWNFIEKIFSNICSSSLYLPDYHNLKAIYLVVFGDIWESCCNLTGPLNCVLDRNDMINSMLISPLYSGGWCLSSGLHVLCMTPLYTP